MLSVDELTDRLIDLSFAEDIGDGDHTTLCCIPETAEGASQLIIKEDGILAGKLARVVVVGECHIYVERLTGLVAYELVQEVVYILCHADGDVSPGALCGAAVELLAVDRADIVDVDSVAVRYLTLVYLLGISKV